MIVVSDTSPLNYLILIDEVDLLRELFDTIYIPEGVRNELIDHSSPPVVSDWVQNSPSWLEVRAPLQVDSTINLERGENEAISLAHEIEAERFLVDDLSARTAALIRGLSVTGTLAILTEAGARGLLKTGDAIKKLKNTTFRASPSLWQMFAPPKSG